MSDSILSQKDPEWRKQSTSPGSTTLLLEAPRCEGKLHLSGGEGHVPSQAASYGVGFGCPSCSTHPAVMLLCAGQAGFWRSAIDRREEIECEACGAANLVADWWQTEIPLGEGTIPGNAEPPPAGPMTLAKAPMAWDTLLEQFAAYERAKGLTARTIENREYLVRALARDTDKPPAEIDIHDLRKRLGRGVSKSTMQTENDVYRAFFRFMHGEGYRSDDLSKALPGIRAPRRKPRPYSLEQIDALLSSGAYGNTRAMILLAFFQGLRAGEVAAVHGRDIDFEANEFRVTGKGDKRATLPLHPTIRDLAESMPKNDWWFPARKGLPGHIQSRSVSDLMKRAKDRAGITNERLTGHSLRHAYGTELVRAGVDLRTVQELLRHESLATTQLYTLINKTQMRDGIVRLGFLDIGDTDQ